MRAPTFLIGPSLLVTIILGLLMVFLSESLLFPFSTALAVTLTLIILSFGYRAPENKAGVIYRLGYFNRLVKPGTYTLRIPLMEWVEKELDLHWKQVDLIRRDTYTQDRYPVEVYARIIYHIDVEKLDSRIMPQIRMFTDTTWDALIRRRGSLILAEAINACPFETAVNAAVWDTIGQYVRYVLDNELGVIGIAVDQVWVQDVRPGRRIEKILQEEKVAREKAALHQAHLDGLMQVLAAHDNGRHGHAIDPLQAALAVRAMYPDASLPPIMMGTPRNNGDGVDELLQTLALLLSRHFRQEGGATKGPKDETGGKPKSPPPISFTSGPKT